MFLCTINVSNTYRGFQHRMPGLSCHWDSTHVPLFPDWAGCPYHGRGGVAGKYPWHTNGNVDIIIILCLKATQYFQVMYIYVFITCIQTTLVRPSLKLFSNTEKILLRKCNALFYECVLQIYFSSGHDKRFIDLQKCNPKCFLISKICLSTGMEKLSSKFNIIFIYM